MHSPSIVAWQAVGRQPRRLSELRQSGSGKSPGTWAARDTDQNRGGLAKGGRRIVHPPLAGSEDDSAWVIRPRRGGEAEWPARDFTKRTQVDQVGAVIVSEGAELPVIITESLKAGLGR
jgi:hypothetical protein